MEATVSFSESESESEGERTPSPGKEEEEQAEAELDVEENREGVEAEVLATVPRLPAEIVEGLLLEMSAHDLDVAARACDAWFGRGAATGGRPTLAQAARSGSPNLDPPPKCLRTSQ